LVLALWALRRLASRPFLVTGPTWGVELDGVVTG
jgi:hypothetical protein